MRHVVLAVMLVACGKSDSKAPAKSSDPPAGELAGRVVELDGLVTAKRGDHVFPLAIGTGVAADDVIDTGDSGRVVIELAKNHARWELAAHQHQRVRDSIVWTVPDTGSNSGVTVRDQTGGGVQPDPAGGKAIEHALDTRKTDLLACLGDQPKITLVIDTGPRGLSGFRVKGGTREVADCVMHVLQNTEMPKVVAHAVVPITKP